MYEKAFLAINWSQFIRVPMERDRIHKSYFYPECQELLKRDTDHTLRCHANKAASQYAGGMDEIIQDMFFNTQNETKEMDFLVILW